jgi:hypothetical protein
MTRGSILLLLLALPAAAAEPASHELTPETLTPKARLAIPWMRVAVGAGRPLAVKGCARPVQFVEGDDGLVLGREDLSDGDTFEILLDDDSTRTYLLRRGDPSRGDPSWWVIALDARAGKIGRDKVLFVDHDGDGTFLTPYRDVIVRKRGGECHPVAPHVVLDREVYAATYDEAAGRISWRRVTKEYATPDVFPNWTGVARGLAYVNRVRTGMNLPPFGLNRDASRRAMLHLRYCSLNGGNPHAEERDRRGYTKDGAEAGINSIGWWKEGGAGVTEAISGHLASLLHRMDLIDPRKTQIGVATGSDRVWIHMECGEYRPWEGQGPSIFPGPGGKWPVGVYAVDNPDPRPKGEQQATGIPVTVAWFGADENLSKVRGELRSGAGRVKCLKNDSERRDLKTNAPNARVVLMARSPLRSGPYQVIVTWTHGGEPKRLTYRFRIAK